MPAPGRRIRKTHQALVEGYDVLRRLAEDETRLALADPRVSGWSIGRHLDHLAKADGLIYGNLREALDAGSAPGDGSPKLIGRVLLFFGRIPRGRAKAVGGTEPEERIDAAELAEAVDDLRKALRDFGECLAEIERLPGTYPHPLLGHFDAKGWLRFSQVHLNHHMRIVREIEAAA